MKPTIWKRWMRASGVFAVLLWTCGVSVAVGQSTNRGGIGPSLRLATPPAGAARPGALPIIGHGTLMWSTPQGWEYTPPLIDVSGKSPMNLRLRAMGGRPTILLTVFWDGFGTNQVKPTLDTLEASLRTSASNQFIPESIEKTVSIRRLDLEFVQARFATFTDSALAASTKPVPEDQSRHATLGTFRAGQLWGNFMLMTNDADGPEFRSALDVIKTLRAAP